MNSITSPYIWAIGSMETILSLSLAGMFSCAKSMVDEKSDLGRRYRFDIVLQGEAETQFFIER